MEGRAQAYTITVELDGQTERQSVDVDKNGCQIETEEVRFFGDCPE